MELLLRWWEQTAVKLLLGDIGHLLPNILIVILEDIQPVNEPGLAPDALVRLLKPDLYHSVLRLRGFIKLQLFLVNELLRLVGA